MQQEVYLLAAFELLDVKWLPPLSSTRLYHVICPVNTSIWNVAWSHSKYFQKGQRSPTKKVCAV